MKQKLLEMNQVTVPNFSYFNEISKMWLLEPKNVIFCCFFEKLVETRVFFGSSSLIFEISLKQKKFGTVT